MSKPGRILIADDEERLLMVTAEYLRHQGYECDAVSNGTLAVQKLKEHSYDLVISDLQMPGNADLSFIRQVPALARGVPVILMTAFPTLDSAIQSIQLPVVAYLVKPVNTEELRNQVRQAIDRSRAYQTVLGNEHRVREWGRDLEQIRAAMESSAAPDPAQGLKAFSALTLRNVGEALLALRNYTDTVAPSSPSVQHLELLSETIAVLEETKRSFKSKTLAELRQKIERQLNAPADTDRAS